MSRVGLALVALLVGACVAASVVPYDVVGDVDVGALDQGPSDRHVLGTDPLGRDVAMRLLLAARAFAAPGALAAAVAVVLGGIGGALAGWRGGALAEGVRFVFGALDAVPRLVLVLLVCATWGSSPGVLGLACGVTAAPALGEALFDRLVGLRKADFVLALRAHGLSDGRILAYHLLWVNGRHLVARHAVQSFAFFLVLETSLSYLGNFGVPEPEPSWGNMLAMGFGRSTANPWSWLAPATAIAAALWGSALVAESRDG